MTAKIDLRRVLDLISPAKRTEEAGGVSPLLQAHLDDIAMSGGPAPPPTRAGRSAPRADNRPGRPEPREGSRAILDRLLEAKPAGGASRPGVTPLMQRHLDDVEVAGAACGCEHRSFTKTVSR